MLYPHAEREGGPWGYIDKTGKVVIELKYDFVWPFSEGLAGVKLKGGKYGFIDSTGRFAIEPQYDWGQSFKNGHASVKFGKMWAIIDRSGATIVPPIYPATSSFSEDRAVVAAGPERPSTKWKWGAVDRAGRIVIEPQFDGLGQFSEGLAVARREGKVGYIDRDGKVAIPFQFERAGRFQMGRAVVFGGPDGKSGLIDRSGALIAAFEFSSVAEFSEGLAVVSVKGPGPDKRYGVINVDGNIVIPPRFIHIGHQQWSIPDARRSHEFSEGLLPVSEAGEKFGYIDRNGRYIIEPQFSRASGFQDGLAVVLMPAKIGLGDPDAEGVLTGLIDRSGQLVTPPIYDWIKIAPGRPPQVKFGKRLGYLDAKGQPLTFSHKDIEDHIKQKREALNPPPPPPGTAILAKAGRFPYYLHLPAGQCALDPGIPQDAKLIDDLDAAMKRIPQAPEHVWGHLKGADGARAPNTGLIASCDQVGKARAGGDGKAIRTYAVARGQHKDRYDRSTHAVLGLMGSIVCQMMSDPRGVPRALSKSDQSFRIWTAFKHLDAGETTLLRAFAADPLTCYSAWVIPAAADKRTPSTGPSAANIRFVTMVLVPDWLIQIITDTSAESPEAVFRELEHERTLARSFIDINLKKAAISKQP